YISHCLIRYQRIMGELYTIISEGKFTQPTGEKSFAIMGRMRYNKNKSFGIYSEEIYYGILPVSGF
ncbi:hypothetical protein, partial [Robinsoniella peoriensis]|uniref:hypothetical protein n=1 Tax=Robinsoniella peoriensis TaxID=180332 RepID=UPI001A9B7490